MKKMWASLNGNKTIICMTMATILEKAIEYDILNESKLYSFIISLLYALGVGAFGHHVKKGYLKRNKGS